MKERKADIVLATVVALTFAAFAAGGVWYLRSLDAWGRQLEEKHSPEAYIGHGVAEKAEAHGLHFYPVWGAAEAGESLPGAALLLGVLVCLLRQWVAPVRQRVMEGNPPRAPAV